MMLRLLIPLLLSVPALAAAPDYCGSLNQQSADNVGKEFTPEQLVSCMHHGIDPPVSWRPDEGRGGAARAGGGGGFNMTTMAAPEDSPGKRNAAASISQQDFEFSMKFPPWAGFPCQWPGGVNICNGDDDGDSGEETGGTDGGASSGNSTCPMATDTTGIFGEKTTLSGSASPQAACGAAVPLTTYQLTVSHNPVGMVSTEYGSPYLWAYKHTGNGNFGAVRAEPYALPTYLCSFDAASEEWVKTTDLSAPIAQMIVYNSKANALAIRLIDDAGSQNPLTYNPNASPEKYLVVPLSGGVPQVPANCANEADVYKTMSALGDVMFETSLTPGCEASATDCERLGLSTAPTSPANCEAVTVYPAQEVSADAPEQETCKDTTQIMVVDRPNLLYPPGSTPQTGAIAGRSGVMAATVEGSSVYTASGSIVQINRSGLTYHVPDGGMLVLPQGAKLIMNGPASIDTASGSITLTHGGEVRDASGTTTSTYNEASTISPGLAWPLVLQLNRNIALPPGYYLPTQPNPYLVAPVVKP